MSIELRVVLFCGVVALGACSTPSAACTAGRVETCPCAGGGSGAQTCGTDGTFGACVCPGADSGTIEDAAVGIDAALAIDAAAIDSGADASADAASDDAGSAVHGHVVLIGHHPGSPNDSVDRLVTNSVFLTAADPIRVLEYTEFAPSVNQAHLNAVIDAEAASRSRAVDHAELAAATGLTAALATTDVFIVPVQNTSEGTMMTTAGFWHDALIDFVEGGGVVVVFTAAISGCSTPGISGYEWRLVEAPDLFSFTDARRCFPSVPTVELEIVDATDPVGAGVISPYAYDAQFTSAFSGAGGQLVGRTHDASLFPVVRHLVR
jgi:hypothetical protein